MALEKHVVASLARRDGYEISAGTIQYDGHDLLVSPPMNALAAYFWLFNVS